MIKTNEIRNHVDTIEHIDEVVSLSNEAQQYLMSFAWCETILNGWLAKDWGYMLCIFYFEIKPVKDSGADNFVWVIVGDIPPAYLDIESASNALTALEIYVDLMEKWIDNVKQGKSVENSFPINVAPTTKYADMLASRIQIIKSDFITQLSLNSCKFNEV